MKNVLMLAFAGLIALGGLGASATLQPASAHERFEVRHWQPPHRWHVAARDHRGWDRRGPAHWRHW